MDLGEVDLSLTGKLPDEGQPEVYVGLTFNGNALQNQIQHPY